MNNNEKVIESSIIKTASEDLVATIKQFGFDQFILQTQLLIQEVESIQQDFLKQRKKLQNLLKQEYSDWKFFGSYQKLRTDLLSAEGVKEVLLKANSFIDEIRFLFLGDKNQIYYIYGTESGRGKNKKIEEYKLSLKEIIELSTITLDSKTRQIKLRIQPTLKKLRSAKADGKIESLEGDYNTFSAIKRYVEKTLKESKTAGPIYETYRQYITQKKVLNLKTKVGQETFKKIYQFSKNSISALKGGDVENEQVKYAGGSFSLTSTLINELKDIKNLFQKLQQTNSLNEAKNIISKTLLKEKKELVSKVEKENFSFAEDHIKKMLVDLGLKIK